MFYVYTRGGIDTGPGPAERDFFSSQTSITPPPVVLFLPLAYLQVECWREGESGEMSTDRFFFRESRPSALLRTYVGPSFVPHMKAVLCVLYTANPSVCVFCSRKRSEEAAVSNFHSNIRTFVFIGRRRRRGGERHKYCAQFWISPPHASID